MLPLRKPEQDLDGIGLEALVSVAVATRPDHEVLREPARRDIWSGVAGASLSHSGLDQRARRLASLLAMSRLPERSKALILAPMGSEQLIAILAALHAGLQPVLLPLSVGGQALQGLFDAAGPCVGIATSRCGDLAPSRMLRDAAARSFNARLVCGFGPDVPDGVVPLDNIIVSNTRLPDAPARLSPSGLLGLVAETSTGTRQVMAEAELMAAAVALARVTRIGTDGRLLSTMMSPGFCALASGPYLALLSGAEYLPLGLFSLSALWAGLSDGRGTTLVAPAGIEDALRAAGIAGHETVRNLLLVHHAAPGRLPRRDAGPGRVLDIHVHGRNELAISERE
ncbi:MAG: AMP-binding protein [Beijerinckiaceae bacterium]|nr:AMP-binding protein [Beijerinckiaceae bacterium]